MTMKELKNRWKSTEGVALLKLILKALTKNKPLDEISGLAKIEDHWDLRGVALSGVSSERAIGNDEHSLNQKFGTFKLKRSKLENIDFSYADISYAIFQECYFENCMFKESKAKEIRVYASDFESCQFIKADFSYSFMNMNTGSNAGSFKNCKFLNTSLKEVIFSFPIMDNCVFENCDLYATNFDGSRMRNLRFSGLVDSAWFRGYSTSAQRSMLWFINKIEPKDYPNKMDNIDFSFAKLRGVSFANGIDISKCIFPAGNEYIYVYDLKKVMTEAKDFIMANWETEYRERALNLIDSIYYKPDKRYQKSDFIDALPLPSSDIDFEKSFFDLIRLFNSN